MTEEGPISRIQTNREELSRNFIYNLFHVFLLHRGGVLLVIGVDLSVLLIRQNLLVVCVYASPPIPVRTVLRHLSESSVLAILLLRLLHLAHQEHVRQVRRLPSTRTPASTSYFSNSGQFSACVRRS